MYVLQTNIANLISRWCNRKSDLSSSNNHANVRYLNTPEKVAKITDLRKQVKNAETEVIKLKEKVLNLMERMSIVVYMKINH